MEEETREENGVEDGGPEEGEMVGVSAEVIDSFEDGGDERYLIFGPNPKASNRYVLLASDWNRNQGVVTYAGQKWVVNSNSAYSSLMVDLERLQQNDVNTRVASGRRVGG